MIGKYQESILIVKLLLPIVILRGIHYVFADALTGAGYQRDRSIIQLFVAMINFTLNIILIKVYGVYGAILSSVLSDLIMTVLIIYTIKKKIKSIRMV
nr:polysaccharide biosynthesis C-terminal domain-containing protein [Sporosarcina sp. E16_8]